MSNYSLGRILNLFVTRSRRRCLVVLVLAAPPLGIVLGVPQFDKPLAPASLTSLSLLIAAGVGLILLLHLASHSATNPRALLDERGLTVRGRAYEVAYWVLAGVLTMCLAYAVAAGNRGLWLPSSPGDWLVVAGLVAYMLMILPASAVAWAESDIVLDQDDAEKAHPPIVYAGRDLGRTHRSMLFLALTASIILIAAQITGLSEHPAEVNYVLGGVITGCLLQLLIAGSSRATR